MYFQIIYLIISASLFEVLPLCFCKSHHLKNFFCFCFFSFIWWFQHGGKFGPQRHPEVSSFDRKMLLTHWGRVKHIYAIERVICGTDNGLLPIWRQAIIWTNAGILLIWTLRTHASELLSEIHAFSFKQMHVKMLSGKWQPFCLSLNVLTLNQCSNLSPQKLLVLLLKLASLWPWDWP